jgi:hypothetical protein
MADGTIPPDSGIAGNVKGAWELVLTMMDRSDVPEVWYAMHPELRPVEEDEE